VPVPHFQTAPEHRNGLYGLSKEFDLSEAVRSHVGLAFTVLVNADKILYRPKISFSQQI